MNNRAHAHADTHQAAQLGLLVAVREEERINIARELHDSVGQEMAALALQINSVLNSCREMGTKKEIRQVCETLSKSYQRIIQLSTQVGRISHLLHHRMLEHVGLANALSGLCTEIRALSGIDVQCSCSPRLPCISHSASLGLYRIAQEALNNICKHAKASAADVRLSEKVNHIELRIADNGGGFDSCFGDTPTGSGLTTMKERARCLLGQFVLKTEPGKGTIVIVRIPSGEYKCA